MLKTFASVLIATSLVAGGAAMASAPAGISGTHKQDMKDVLSKHKKDKKDDKKPAGTQ